MTIGWYVHHHGAGHRQRALSVLAHVTQPAVVLSQSPRPRALPPSATWIALPSDVAGGVPGDVTAGGRLHWAPQRSGAMRRWAAALVDALDRHDVTLLVSDVSVEATVLARTAGVPVVSMRQHGDRTDPAHALGYDLSVAAIAPYPEWFEQPGTGRDLRAKTTYVGGLCRWRRRAPSAVAPTDRSRDTLTESPTVAVLLGAGGTAAKVEHLDGLAARSQMRWIGLGHAGGDGAVEWRGVVAEPAELLARADVVVSSAGHNSVMECAALRRPLVCVPETRPFDEQSARARLLADLGLAIVVDHWSALQLDDVAAAQRLGGERLAALADPAAARRTARLLERLAA